MYGIRQDIYAILYPETLCFGVLFLKRLCIKYGILLLTLFCLCGASFASLRPCGAGFAVALLYCGQPAVAVLPAFLAFTLLFDFSVFSLVYALSVCVAAFVAALLALHCKRGKRALYALFLTVAQTPLLLLRAQIGVLLLPVWGILCLGVFVASVCFLHPILVKKCRYAFLETELVCGCVLLVCLSLGLRCMRVRGVDFCYAVAAFCIPFAVAVRSLSAGVAVGMCFGGGIALYDFQPAPIAFLAFAALLCAVFAAAPKPLASLSTAVAFVLVAYLFDTPPSVWQTASFAAGALLFSLVPNAWLGKIRDALFSPATAAAARGIIHRTAAQTGNMLLEAAQVFTDMQHAVERVPAAIEGVTELESKVCARCPQYAVCSALPEYRNALQTMERSSAALGRASVSEIPALLSSCRNLTALVAQASSSAQARHEQIVHAEARAEGRKIVGEQLSLMSDVLRQMGARVKTPVHFDTAKEKEIGDELAYRGAAVAEVIVSEENVSVVLGSSLTDGEAARAVSKIMRAPYAPCRRMPDVLPGYTMLLFTRAPRYDVEFSMAASAKESKSGDNHSFIRLGGDRFMMALCDGMGSGEEAEKASHTAIELVEGFFRAGLGSLRAVECVNRFLAMGECERFSTLDVTVIDLNTGDAEIIKLSAPATVIRANDGVRAVTGAALPMGVFEEVTCGHTQLSLCAGDEIVMATDGITDALGSTEALISAVALQTDPDPKAAAKNILDAAVIRQKGALKDDATVLCARIVKKREEA